ncbi:probable glutathione S-transferase [Euphorbia lathyris]|uniref:probable glutathione S-transferase n=1 Tax=Euphorbia lathyris TaxID=212925 RepID=UPI003314061D
MGEVKVLGAWGSPFSRRVEIALKLKGVQYEYIEQDLANKTPLLLKYNPIHKKVPVLIHNGKPIVESLVILEYIDETWKGYPIFPTDPYLRAMARFWTNFIDQKCNPAILQIIWSKEKEREKVIEEARQHLKTLENELKGNKFFGGERIGAVDICANLIGFWLGVIQDATRIQLVNKDKFPILCKWIHEYLSCSIINENLPPREKLLSFFQSRFIAQAWYY